MVIIYNIWDNNYNYQQVLDMLSQLESDNLLNAYVRKYLPDYWNNQWNAVDKFLLIEDLKQRKT